MNQVTKIDGLCLTRMIVAGAAMLEKNKDIIDALNVFPVPDGDTGTNMSMTTMSAAKEAEKKGGDKVSEVAAAASGGSLRGARGNSGVILSQLFRGFARGLADLDTATTQDLAHACARAVETAYKAVMKPKEGTILTVAKFIADYAARSAAVTDDIGVFMDDIITAGEEILERTTEMLPSLKQAGVVDAGGQGLLCILRGAYIALNGSNADFIVNAKLPAFVDYSALSGISDDDITFTYCTEFFINVETNANIDEEETEQAFKSYLDGVGDSIVAVCDGNIIKIHVHTNNPGQVLEKAIEIGALSNIKIENMRVQHTEKVSFAPDAVLVKKVPKKRNGFVVVASGLGFSEIFRSLGADAVVEGGQSMNPSTDDIIRGIESVNAEDAFVFPNNKNIILAAEQAAKLVKDTRVHVIKTRSVPQGITALCAFSETDDVKKNVAAMTEALDTVHCGQTTRAVRDTVIDGMTIAQGDVLCMYDGEIVFTDTDLLAGAKRLADKMVTPNVEIMTIYYGEGAENTDALMAYVSDTYAVDVEVKDGGQSVYSFIISAE